MMDAPLRQAPFVLVSTNHGTMIVNRNDHNVSYGVGFQLLSNSAFDPEEIEFSTHLINLKRKYQGDGLVVLDCGANIGTHTVEWGRHMHGWGRVISFEAQEIVYYALAGNVVINNCLNVSARNCAVGSEVGFMKVPRPDYLKASSYGSLELKPRPGTEFIGQSIDYDNLESVVPVVSIDSLNLDRLDFVKLDIEGMENEALRGAERSLANHKPILVVETFKSDLKTLLAFLHELGYLVLDIPGGVVAIHKDDPVMKHVNSDESRIWLT